MTKSLPDSQIEIKVKIYSLPVKMTMMLAIILMFGALTNDPNKGKLRPIIIKRTNPETDSKPSNQINAATIGDTHAEFVTTSNDGKCHSGLAMDAVQAANSGHPGMPMGMADAATALFCDHLKFDSASPDWPDRDRFVLSAGHGSMLIYALLHLTGYEDMTIDQIRNFRQLGARTAGHPEFGHAKGIETTTGPLGQGIANAVGMAMARTPYGHPLWR